MCYKLSTMFIKRLLFRVFGPEKYLLIISKLFFFSYYTGIIKGKPYFRFHYFFPKMVKAGDTVIDIGANLGYYTLLYAQCAQHVYAVEPVKLFRKVLSRNVGNKPNITILPYALGAESNKLIEMGVPSGKKFFRHGLTHVVENNEEQNTLTFQETMMRPNDLFGHLEKVDFIKCDIEGYEKVVIPELKEIIAKHLPVIQLETDMTNRIPIMQMLFKLGYSCYFLQENNRLQKVSSQTEKTEGDLLFIPDDSKKERIAGFANN